METETSREVLTIDQFIARHSITLTASKIPLVSWWEGDKEAQSWQCVLKCGPREMSTTYTKGSGHRIWGKDTRKAQHFLGQELLKKPAAYALDQPAQRPFGATHYDERAFMAWTRPTPPTAAEVLDSLALDASSADQSFEDWCADFGSDTDSRTAERTYNACRETMFNLRKLLGGSDFETLLNDVERM